ncbi:MAG TPA: AAA family ATPase [Pseudomonadales bacterium]|nr:AAA family ATPase [Pseudomonadales bacterium]
MSDTRDLGLILDSRIPIIVIESPDERRVLALLLQFAMQRGLPFSEWSATRGLRRGGLVSVAVDEPKFTDPTEALVYIGATPGPALYALCDVHPYLPNEPKIVRHIKDIAHDYEQLGNTLVLVSHSLTIPQELSRLTATFNLRLPSDDELLAMIRKQAQEWARLHKGRKVSTDAKTLDKLIANLRGVTHSDAQILIRRAVFADGVISDDDIPEINKLKFELLDADGVLHYEYDTESFAHVAGLDNLKAWLGVRESEFLRPTGTDRPKGLLLLGVQGSGKSVAAKSVAGQFGVPLLRLDFGTLYNKYFGETERNLRNSLRQAELMAPCVLWLDEIEKGIATGDSDNATSKRVLATMLTWMAENKHPVFIVATSNDIAELPPELVRKGRMDEIFFVDLPDAKTRKEIFRIHLEKRGIDPTKFDLADLAEHSDGFTGAEIEEAIVSARYVSASHQTAVTSDDVLAALNRTYPMSVLRADVVQSLRAWAKDRTVPA